ncbi:MAG: M64 family metallopeptidase [bacterium]
MKQLILFLFLVLSHIVVLSQSKPDFNTFFLDRTMRIDLFFTGDAKEQIVTVDRIKQEGIWSENPAGLIEPYNYGPYVLKVVDVASNQLIFTKSFSSIFAEYRTTTPALNGVKRVYDKSVRIPFPKRSVQFVLESRDKKNLLSPVFTITIDPADYHILKESMEPNDYIYTALNNGDPKQHVDLVLLGEGYTASEKDKFKADVDRMMGYLFEVEPYKSAKAKFNVFGVLRPSAESAMDEPRQGKFKKTTFNASFNAFDTDRYMLTEENRRIHDVASQVPCDAIVIIVNSKRYGGGGIYGDYAISTADNNASKMVMIHEFGHSFAGLADEYYTSDVAYNDLYPKGVEPLEPNITALLDPTHVKWQEQLSPGIDIPTKYGKDEIEALQEERRNNRDKAKEIEEKIQSIRKQYSPLNDKVGVFEGAGYSSKGLFRPMVYCIMISHPKNEFCLVCQIAIQQMIEHYTAQAH